MKKRLYDEFIKLLVEANDETKTQLEHDLLVSNLRGWEQGVEDAAGHRFNGDYYYMEMEPETFSNRPMCAGLFLDWKEQSK